MAHAFGQEDHHVQNYGYRHTRGVCDSRCSGVPLNPLGRGIEIAKPDQGCLSVGEYFNRQSTARSNLGTETVNRRKLSDHCHRGHSRELSTVMCYRPPEFNSQLKDRSPSTARQSNRIFPRSITTATLHISQQQFNASTNDTGPEAVANKNP